ncbi:MULTISPECIES: hypothetical protein [unclassified Nocardiopsis]|uniref:hypothetical protein n=1 Tax=Nocardiopsis TaxID=2013 RepID=UPI00387AC306
MTEKKRVSRQMLQARNTPVIGWSFTVLGAVLLALNLWLIALGAFNPAVLIAIVLLVAGPLHLRRHTFELVRYSDGRIAFSGPGWFGSRDVGPTRSGERFLVEGGRIVFESADGGRRRLPVYRWLTRRSDWERAVRIIEGDD